MPIKYPWDIRPSGIMPKRFYEQRREVHGEKVAGLYAGMDLGKFY